MKAHTSKIQKGFGLVELMISLAVGLLVTGGVLSIFVANRQAFRVSENLSRLQENGRTAFETISRDIREAGGNPCGTKQIGNVINNFANFWWANWDAGTIRGFDNSVAGDGASGIAAVGNGVGERLAGTDAVLILSGNVLEGVMIATHAAPAANFSTNTTQHGINDGDVMIACDYRSGALFQVTNASSANTTIVHNTGAVTPGNCSKGLGYPTLCTVNGTAKTYENGGMLVKLYAALWYVGNNARGGTSLFRATMVRNPANSQPSTQIDEVAEGIQDLQLRYLMRNTITNALGASFIDGSAVADWTLAANPQVAAVEVTLNASSKDSVGTDAAPLQRLFPGIVQLRNRDIP